MQNLDPNRDISTQLYSLLSFVTRSKNRLKIMKKLQKGALFPSELVKQLKINFPTVNKSLKELEKKHLIVCETPTLNKGKYYNLTSTGKEILKKLDDPPSSI
jgi:predicted transcriptional regulator